MNKPLVSLTLALSCAAAWPAEGPTQLPAKVAACASVQDAVQRLTCYDREATALLPKAPVSAAAPAAPPARAAAPAPTPVPAAVPVVPATAAASFGQELIRKKARPDPAGDDQRLHATVTAVREPVPGEYRVTLDNGQAWRQQEAKFGFSLKVGDVITIGKGSMGSYRLWRDEDGSKAWVPVTRIN